MEVGRCRQDSRLSHLLRAIKDTALGAQAHQDLPFEQLVEALKLERSLIFALLILTVGVMLLVNAILSWRNAHYGALSYPDSLRKIIPAVTLITFGVQWLFFSFFLSVLQLEKRPSSGNG